MDLAELYTEENRYFYQKSLCSTRVFYFQNACDIKLFENERILFLALCTKVSNM